MLTPERKFLLSCMADFVRGEPSLKPEETLDWKEVFRLSNEHCLDSLVFSQCRRWMGVREDEDEFRPVFAWHVFYSVNRGDFLREIAERFRKEDVSLLAFKGSVLRDYYPEPALRTMGDVDLVIRTADREKADHILREDMGLERMIDNHSVWTYYKGPFQFEIHDRMFYEDLANKVDYKGYFDRVWDHCHNAPVFGIGAPNLYIPDEEFHFLYLMTHTAKHVLNNGTGFRAYLDMVQMVKGCGERMDWPWITEELEKLKLLTFTKTCFSCCERWFGIEMPMRLESLSEELFSEITEKTFRDGVFGLENAENSPASAAKDIKRSESPYFLGAVKRGFKRLFPPYRDMQLVPWYSWIDGKPWLLPAAWAYRFAYCGAKKLRHSVKFLAEPFSKKKDVLKRQSLMKDWGL